MLEYKLIFDGGSRGNPGPSYGSYRVQAGQDRPQKPVRLDFGLGTNNEAEYQALIAGLKEVLSQVEKEGYEPEQVRVEVRGDSRLVLNQLKGTWKAKDARMRAFRDEAQDLIRQFGAHRLVHQNRNRTVDILGH